MNSLHDSKSDEAGLNFPKGVMGSSKNESTSADVRTVVYDSLALARERALQLGASIFDYEKAPRLGQPAVATFCKSLGEFIKAWESCSRADIPMELRPIIDVAREIMPTFEAYDSFLKSGSPSAIDSSTALRPIINRELLRFVSFEQRLQRTRNWA